MPETDLILVKRYADQGDEDAFAEIINRYADPVYNVCLRILGDPARACDAAQETFFQLVKTPRRISGSLTGWLHRVATRKAIDHIRNDRSRREHELRYNAEKSLDVSHWKDLSPHVDQALDEIDPESRNLLIRHFFNRRSQKELAAELDLSQPTVSRKIDAALARLHRQLKRKGLLMTAGALGALLAENVAEAAPILLMNELNKIAVVGAAQSAVGGSTILAAKTAKIVTAAAAVQSKLVAVGAIVAAGVIGVITYQQTRPAPPNPAPPAVVNRQANQSVSRPANQPSQPTRNEPQAIEVTAPEKIEPQPAEAPSSTPAAAAVVTTKSPVETVEPPDTDPSPDDNNKIDLTSPESTVRSFTKMAVTGNPESVLKCYLPGGTDYEDVAEIMNAQPDDSKYSMKLMFLSLDPDADMPILSVTESPAGISVTWTVTFKKEFSVQGHVFNPGDTMDLDATLVKVGNNWLIDNF